MSKPVVKILKKAGSCTWVSPDGNFKIWHYEWCAKSWGAEWIDFMGVKHTVWEFTRARLMDRLKPYSGETQYRLSR